MQSIDFLKVVKGFLLSISLMFIVTGCWDSIEVEQSAFVSVIGLDKLGSDKIEITYLISNPQGGGFSNVVGSSQKEPPAEIITLKVPDILSARDLLGASVTRQITFTHTKTLVVSEELARSGLFLSNIEAALRDREIRRDMFLVVSKEKASEFIRGNDPKLETRPHKFYEFMSERWKDTALVPLSTMHTLLERTEGKAGLFLNIYGTTQKFNANEAANEDEYLASEINKSGGNPIQMIGSAVFKDGKMIGTLNGEETRLSQLLRPNFQIPSLLSTYQDPLNKDYRISVRIIKEEDTKVKIVTQGDYPKLDIKVSVLFDILAVPSGIDYIKNFENQQLLESYVSKAISEKAEKLVEKTQEEFGGDPFMWSTAVRKKLSTWDEYERYNWMGKYPQAQVSVRFEAKIRRLGKQGSPSEAIRTGDDK
ncbi:Ger(x)C family spore germination protein [Pseudobacteroides cellulosolvens]|uniref:Germination protein, Ger(X)C family n=1 Tax=Pseudobacteroides cellulosolvens ATCC 35603 = DSM 2933 TaxID=398512 RepID=A0A0L6JU66_9FIRM|nr:Ger(x)C family spore germination protein [Pseudobacteroides cellulosolvens]KNY28972.1 germination protein, Ger(x)C family [Pseudobacteroides cellulosolvens ATCC 35603 = DSM 2933]